MKDRVIISCLQKSFGEKKVFDGLSVSFGDHGVYAIVGESGRGKTTLLRLICGLERPDGGSIVGGGMKACSFAFQEYRLFPTLNALENVVVALPRGDSAESARQMLLSLMLDESDLQKYPSELSGGMKQRVSLARALVSDRPILLLDEPTKELDEERRKRLLSVIQEAGKAKTVIMVTHNSDDILSVADHVISL